MWIKKIQLHIDKVEHKQLFLKPCFKPSCWRWTSILIQSCRKLWRTKEKVIWYDCLLLFNITLYNFDIAKQKFFATYLDPHYFFSSYVELYFMEQRHENNFPSSSAFNIKFNTTCWLLSWILPHTVTMFA